MFAKRFELLRELLPNASAFGLLVNPSNPNTKPSVREALALAQAGRWELHVVEVRNVADIENGFASLARLRVGGFLTGTCAKVRHNCKKRRKIRTYGILPALKSASGVTPGVTEPESRALARRAGSGRLTPAANHRA